MNFIKNPLYSLQHAIPTTNENISQSIYVLPKRGRIQTWTSQLESCGKLSHKMWNAMKNFIKANRKKYKAPYLQQTASTTERHNTRDALSIFDLVLITVWHRFFIYDCLLLTKLQPNYFFDLTNSVFFSRVIDLKSVEIALQAAMRNPFQIFHKRNAWALTDRQLIF